MNFKSRWYHKLIYVAQIVFIFYLLVETVIRALNGGDWLVPLSFFLVLTFLIAVMGGVFYNMSLMVGLKKDLAETRIQELEFVANLYSKSPPIQREDLN